MTIVMIFTAKMVIYAEIKIYENSRNSAYLGYNRAWCFEIVVFATLWISESER